MINDILDKLKQLFAKSSKEAIANNESYDGSIDGVEGVRSGLSGIITSFSKQDKPTNYSIKGKQGLLLLVILVGGIAGVLVLIKVVQGKRQEQGVKVVSPKLKVEVASDTVDGDKMWQTHFEDKLIKNEEQVEGRLKAAEQLMIDKEKELQEETKLEITKLHELVKYAKEELLAATLELERVRKIQEGSGQGNNGNAKGAAHMPATMNSNALSTTREFDHPKSSKVYIPETTYVGGYLLGGIAVSTGLNAPNENATPVFIRLKSRGNLPKNFNLDVSTCKLMGSSYGDISSERAVIRLEKMICTDPKTELVTTSEVAGIVYGPDGMNGIKGNIVATSTRHIRNAMLGGVISGLASSAKGQEGMSITSLGAVNTKKKSFGSLASGGVLAGTSTAAEKIADYYLRQAEAMSPVLTIPGGVKVDVMFTKGFYVGEVGTHQQIERLRRSNQASQSGYGNQARQTSENNNGYDAQQGD